MLSASVATWLDTHHGEGVSVLLYPIGFAPVLLGCYFLLRRLATLAVDTEVRYHWNEFNAVWIDAGI